MNGLDLSDPSTRGILAEAEQNAARFLPAEFGETFDVAWRSGTEFNNSIGYQLARSRALGDYADDIYQKTGERLPSLAEPSGELQMYGAVRPPLEVFNEAQAKLQEKYPGLDYLSPLTDERINQMARDRMRKAHDDAGAMSSRETTWGGTAGTVLGALASGFADPVLVATLPLGGVGEAGIALRALEFAAIGGGTTAAAAAIAAPNREEAVRGSSREIPGEILGATIVGGLLGGGFAALGKLFKAGGKALPTATREDLNAVTSEAQLNATNPFPTAAGEAAARDALSDAVTSSVRGEAVRAGERFDPVHIDALGDHLGARSPDEFAARAEARLRPETFGERADIERFDPLPAAGEDAAAYWERRLEQASDDERTLWGVEPSAPVRLPDLPQGAILAEELQHGPRLVGLADRPEDAITWLREAKTGQVDSAVVHPDIGPIDFVYGEPRGQGGGYGIAKMAEEHADFLENIGDRLRSMKVSNEGVKPWRNGQEIVLSDANGRAIIKTEWDGEKTRLLFNGFNFGGERRPPRDRIRSPRNEGSAPQSQTRPPSVDGNIAADPPVVDVPPQDLSPAAIARLADDAAVPQALDHDVEHILAANPEAEISFQTRLDDGSYKLDTMKLKDVLADLEADERAGKELLACAVGLEAAE